MLTVKEVKNTGVFSKLGIIAGDIIEKFNSFNTEDILDYLYYDASTSFTITVLRNGERLNFNVDKEENESMGAIFESDNLDIITCRNKCIFCFVDQMPSGMRPSLYVKDDDYRQSFLTGNFVTLTNVSDEQIDRIIRLNLSPLYVSVHTMNGDLRKTMLNNRFAGNIVNQLKKLTDAGIKVDAQIVLVPGVNDGKELEYSIRELYKLAPNLRSVAVVPCGITKYRNGLYEIKDITKGYADCVITWVDMLNAEFKSHFVQAGDEFYFKAQKPLPNADYYGDFSQIGNGVGTTVKFKRELKKCLRKKNKAGKYLIITGESASEFIKQQAELVNKYSVKSTYNVLAVKNEFFGETVNCSGLLTGQDIIKSIKNCTFDYDALVLPNVCLRTGEDVFLDDTSLTDLKNMINKKIIVTDGSGQSFFDALTGGDNVRIIK